MMDEQLHRARRIIQNPYMARLAAFLFIFKVQSTPPTEFLGHLYNQHSHQSGQNSSTTEVWV
jgi:hypothetical protein